MRFDAGVSSRGDEQSGAIRNQFRPLLKSLPKGVFSSKGGLGAAAKEDVVQPLSPAAKEDLGQQPRRTLAAAKGGLCHPKLQILAISSREEERHVAMDDETIKTVTNLPVAVPYASSASEFLSTCKVANLTVKAELGYCLLHRSGRLIIDGCILQCESNPIDYLSYAIVSTANGAEVFPRPLAKTGRGDGVSVSRTRIEGGAKAVSTSETLALQHVRVIYAQTSVFFWFDVEHR
ncbi:protein with RING/U-box and TRAF-like domain [Actinidia rufa]|uniref:Protein with RING/U-box and TRAF-like domain n=1 Tax=Actinidia rufa TaxID=165716 RepID=A0A7J0F8D9_9ERIC|nr:protein with RING/U-box and TRAF-like domain [Actinidia rufa]